MAKNVRVEPSASDSYVLADEEPLNLRNRYLAAFLSWLVPGAGHFYQGRTFKASIYFASVMMCVVVGMVVSGGRCVYASWNGVEKRWQFALQAGVGLPAIPAVIQGWRKSKGNDPFLQGWFTDKAQSGESIPGAPFASPESFEQLDAWNQKTASGFELGTLYTMIAGLLNLLAVYDAYGGPLPPPNSGTKKNESPETADSTKNTKT